MYGSDELNVLLQHLGVNLENEQLEDLLKEINPSKSGEISFDEFYDCKPNLPHLSPLPFSLTHTLSPDIIS